MFLIINVMKWPKTGGHVTEKSSGKQGAMLLFAGAPFQLLSGHGPYASASSNYLSLLRYPSFLFVLRHLVNLEPPNMTQMLRSKFWDNFYNSSKLQCVVCWCKFNWGRGGGLRGDRWSNPLSARRRKRRRLISSLQTFQSADGSLTMGARRVTQEQPHRYATEQDLNGSFKVATLPMSDQSN